jgi:hypothetical protein
VDGSGACGPSEPLLHIHAGDTRLSSPPRVVLPLHRSAGKGIRLDDVPPAVDSDSESDAASENGAGPAQESGGSPASGSGAGPETEEEDSADEDGARRWHPPHKQ